MTTGAQERAREIVAEARSRAEDEVNRLNGLKQRLSEDVETLTRQLDTERKRLSGALAEFSRWVESSLAGRRRARVGRRGARTGTTTAQATTGAGPHVGPGRRAGLELRSALARRSTVSSSHNW